MSKREDDKPSLVAALTPAPGPGGTPAKPAESSSGAQFIPGTVFAGRYRMITRIGRGGMGEVWHADDLVLETAVALKLVRSASQDARDRLLREVRLARSITHPAVCRVYDIGEADGQVFYSMELVWGEDLATLLKRAGRLPPERVVAIGRQLCEAVGAAHTQGVLHRDLKPGNILVDENGSIRITDFGIATVRTDATGRTRIGTPAYMAPEQLRGGTPLSERTDVYAIGLILYELLVGERPFADASAAGALPPKPSTRVPDVDPRLERVILKALSPAPEDRHASAAAIAAALPSSAPGERGWRLLVLATAAVIVGAAAFVGVRWFTTRPTLTDQDTIVLADFLNQTDDPVFDGTLKVATAVALEQSPFLKVFPDAATGETLRLMARQPDEAITRELARDIAQRERLKAFVAGSIGPLGSRYVLTLEAIDAQSGDTMAREQVQAPGKEQVLGSLGAATAKLREKLGESLPSIQKYDAPLARATTPSLEALHAYSLALDNGRVFLRVEAIPHLRRAIELDPDFALAHALLSGVYASTGQSSEAPPHARKAFELRDRVSERERYFISWRYYVDALQSWDKALELASAWTVAYPREAFAFNSLGLALETFGQHERAVEVFRQAMTLDPKFVPPHRNLAQSLVALNRYDDARAVIDEGARNGITSMGLTQMKYLVDFVMNDRPAVARAAQGARTDEDRMWSVNFAARAAAFSGRIQESHQLLQRSIQTAQTSVGGPFRELAPGWILMDAETHALAGTCEDMRTEVTAALRLSRDNFSLERAGRLLGLCGDADMALQLSKELAARFPDATLTTRIHLPLIAATVALQRGDAARVQQLLEDVRPYDQALASEFWPAFLRGQASLQQRNGGAAEAEFRSILVHRGAAPTSVVYPLAQLGLARAIALTGDRERARAAYGAFLTLWRDADANLKAVQEARAEYDRLM